MYYKEVYVIFHQTIHFEWIANLHIIVIFIQGVPKTATFQIQISAVIQTTYCIFLKFITSFIHMGDEIKLLII